MESLLLFLKIVGLAASAIFGILGTIHDFRSESGNLTKWGKVAIIGTIASALVAVSAQIIEVRLQELSAREASQLTLQSTLRIEQIVQELKRANQPLESIELRFINISLPMEDPRLTEYKKRLDEGIDRFLKISDPLTRLTQAGFSIPTVRSEGDKEIPLSVAISKSDPLFANFTQGLVGTVLRVDQLVLSFYKEPISASNFQPLSHGFGYDPDLRVSSYAKSHFSVNKEIEENAYLLNGWAEFDRSTWEDRTGRIISIPDFAGVQMFIAFEPLGTGNSENSDFLELRQKMAVTDLNIRVGKRSQWIQPSMIKRHITKSGQTFFEFNFPNDPRRLFSEEQATAR